MQDMVDIRSNGKFLPCRFLARRRRSADFSEKMFPRSCWDDVLSKVTTFFTASRLVTIAGFIIFIRKPSDIAWNGVTQLSSKKQQAKAMPSTCKTMGTVIWCDKGWILVEFVPQWEPIRSLNVPTLQKLSRALRDERPGKRDSSCKRKTLGLALPIVYQKNY